MTPLYAAVAAAVCVVVLAGCGSDDGTVAEDSTSTASSTPTDSPTDSPTPEPTAEPTVGSYPPFEPESYTYHLVESCFCLGAGVPIKVSVVDGEVVKATYLADDSGRSGVKKGDPADKSFWHTINDIIDKANDTTAAHVEVVWPPGQDYPSSVYVDEDEQMVDEEVGYAVSHVKVR